MGSVYFNPFVRPPGSTRLAAWCYSPKIVWLWPFSTSGYYRVWIMRYITAIVLFISAATGCAVVPAQQSNNELVVQDQTHDDKALPSETDQTSELIFQYLLGDIASRRGDGSRAAESMANAAQISADPQVAVRAYRLSMHAGDFERALKMSGLLKRLLPESDQPYFMALGVLAKLGRHDAFFDQMVLLLDRPSSSIGPHLRRASQILGEEPDPVVWMPVMERLVERYHRDPQVYLAQAWLAYRAERPEIADTALNQALVVKPGWEKVAMMRLSHLKQSDNRKQLTDYAETFLRDYPDSSELRITWARLLAEWNEFEKALSQFTKLVEHDPENKEAVYAAAVLNMELGNDPIATRMFVRYLELDPEHDQSRLFLARIAAGQDRFDDALSWLSEVTSAEYIFDAQLRTAFVLADAKRADEALAHLIQMVPDSVPEQVRIYLAQERILRQSEGLEAALELLDAALIDVPGHGDLLYARGLVTAQLKLIDKHEADMRRLIELEPDNAHAYNALGYTLADQTDRLDEALVLIERALVLLPEDPFILDSMGWVHYRLGNNDLAREYLQKAIDLRLDAEIAAHLGEVLWMDGERDQARTVWQRGHENDPDNSVLRETLRKFEP